MDRHSRHRDRTRPVPAHTIGVIEKILMPTDSQTALPLDSRVQAGQALCPELRCFGRHRLPHNLRCTGGLTEFLNRCAALDRTEIGFDVSVGKQFDVSSKIAIGIGVRPICRVQGRSHRVFVDFQNRCPGIMAWRLARLVALNSCGKLPVVPIVHKPELKHTSCIC